MSCGGREGKAKYLLVVTQPNHPALAASSLVGLGSGSLLPSSWTDSFLSLLILQCSTLETASWKDEMGSISYSRIKCCQVAGLVVCFSTVIIVNLVIKVESSTDCFMKSLYLSIFVRFAVSFWICTELQNLILVTMSHWRVGCFCFGAYV